MINNHPDPDLTPQIINISTSTNISMKQLDLLHHPTLINQCHHLNHPHPPLSHRLPHHLTHANLGILTPFIFLPHLRFLLSFFFRFSFSLFFCLRFCFFFRLCLFFYRFFQRRVEELVVGMEQEAVKLVEVLNADTGNRTRGEAQQ